MKIDQRAAICSVFLALAAPGLRAQATRSSILADPGGAPAGSPDLQVTLYKQIDAPLGSLPVTILWNGSPRPTQVVNGQLTVTLSAADLASPGLNEVTAYDYHSGTMWPGGCKFPVYLSVSANDLVYDASRRRFYASVPSTAGLTGNHVVAMNPDTGDVEASVFVGSEPDRMAISGDSKWLYVFNDGAVSIVRIALDSFQADTPFYPGGTVGVGLDSTPTISVLPASPDSILVGQNGFFKVFDNGTPRSQSAIGLGVVAWTSPSTFLNPAPTLFNVTATGVTATTPAGSSNGRQVQDVRTVGGRAYLSNGQVFDAATLALLGTFSGSGLVEVDAANHRAFFLGGGLSAYAISAFDTDTFIPQGAIPIPDIDDSYGNAIGRLVRFGPDGIAFPYRAQSYTSPWVTDRVFIFHSALFGPAPVIGNTAIVNAASSQGGAIAPGEIVTIYGAGLGPRVPRTLQLRDPGTVDTAAGDTQVFFNDVAAPLLFTSSGQVNAVVPYAVSRATSPITVQVSYLGIFSNAVKREVQTASPALFMVGGGGSGQAAAINRDGSLNSKAHPAPRGSVISLYATGEGLTNPTGSDGKLATAPLAKPDQTVRVTIGGVDATVQYAGGAPGLVAGVMQVNVVVPPQVLPGQAAPVVLSVGGISSPATATIAVQ